MLLVKFRIFSRIFRVVSTSNSRVFREGGVFGFEIIKFCFQNKSLKIVSELKKNAPVDLKRLRISLGYGRNNICPSRAIMVLGFQLHLNRIFNVSIPYVKLSSIWIRLFIKFNSKKL